MHGRNGFLKKKRERKGKRKKKRCSEKDAKMQTERKPATQRFETFIFEFLFSILFSVQKVRRKENVYVMMEITNDMSDSFFRNISGI